MNQAKEDLLLHPVRLRILLAVAGREVTAQQLASELPDIPQATLYRNINTLAGAGFLCVVRERRVHNTIEKTYALPSQAPLLTLEDLKNARPEDYVRLFTQYLGQLLGFYVRYIQSGDVDFGRDNVFFSMFPVYLNAAETRSLAQAINATFAPYQQNASAPDRQRTVFGIMALPDVSSRTGDGSTGS